MVHHSRCPLCKSENIQLHFRVADNFISREEFPLFKCNECSLKFTQDYPDEYFIPKYYESEDYISHSNTTKSFSDKLYQLARNMMLQKKMKLVINKTHLATGNILDIGSGTGYFANKMAIGGWHASGIEINKKARDFSINQFGLEVISPEEISSLKSGSFDCITLWHVLEHFHDPFRYAEEIKRLLKNNGACIIALPNSDSFDAVHYGAFWAAYDVPRHLWHFNPSAFRLFADMSGFEIDEILTLPLDVFYISILSQKYKGSFMAFPMAMIKATWFSLKTLFNKRKSSSLIYVLRKK